MSFDLKAAQAVCYELETNKADPTKWICLAATMLPATLDEIERLRKALALKIEQHKGQAYVIGSYLGMLTDFNELNESQAKRIAELEADKAFWQKRSQTLREVCNAAELQDNKSRAALKKLAQAKRERGKALVEERARFNVAMKVVPLNTNFPNSDHKKAREQLRREGKI